MINLLKKGFTMKRMTILFFLITLSLSSHPSHAAERLLTIIHSNDLHSHFLGTPSNLDYTPDVTGNDHTLGGWARIATVIKAVKKDRRNPVLVLDAGDFLMGSLFHLLSREQAFELRLMKMMGYDMTTLGNHEFDLKPRGLARILNTAHRFGQMPDIVCSNAVFSPQDPADDELEKVFSRGLVRPYRIMVVEGIRIGFFGLMGKDAAEVAPFASPVHFADPVASARKMVKLLREKEKVDMVICLSHSGLSPNKKRSEDEILAREVKGIDVIISGHTHTKLDKPILVNGTIIVQAWAYGKQLGVLDVKLSQGKVSLKSYRAIPTNDTIKGDPEISKQIQAFEDQIDRDVLSADGWTFKKIMAETSFDLTIKTEESNLGNLIADALRWDVQKSQRSNGESGNKVDVSVISNGVIRDPIGKGKTGRIAVCDVFRAIPLGIGFDEAETMGYPLISIYVYPSELKKALEILTSIYPLKGSDYFLQISGLQFTYNPYRMIFDRVTEIRLGNDEEGYTPLDYSPSNKRLLHVVADIYNATFLKIVGNFTWHILDIVPKDKNGRPVKDLKTMRVDADRKTPGIQELKEWKAVMEYVGSFKDTDGDGIPNIPEKYRGKLGRNVIEASLNPYKLLKRGTYVTWTAFGALLLIVLLLLAIGRFIRRKIRR
jgi:5'-nucleotidase / UDP-sugar diphosphatase